MVDQAERFGLEFLVFYAFVPAYDFSTVSDLVQAISIEHDFRAWYDLMRRINHMCEMEIDLSELEEQSHELRQSMNAKIAELEGQMPDLDVHAYLADLEDDFDAEPFVAPLSDVWGRALGNLLRDDDKEEE